MTQDLKTRADTRLEAALSGSPTADPRPLYRPTLRYLKERDPAAFERAIHYFDDVLVPAVAGGADPLAAWMDFGRRLVQELGSGRLLAVDRSGRATADDAPGDGVALFVPDDAATPALALRAPADPSPAQRATIELLVQGRVTASAYDR